ncbi:hypothetical protein PENTCL1PPCAC_12171, partial [Pristionchus entomophagus]
VLVIVVVSFTHAQNECNVYNQLETATRCGASGYALSYGLPNCLNFINKAQMFDSPGKDFIKCTRTCLVQFVQQELIAKKVNN